MVIVWWSGRGYLVMLIVLGTLSAFGLLHLVSGVDDGPLLWGSGLLAAAAINWQVGSKLNRKKLRAIRPSNLRERLIYRTRQRFMSLPMETFSLIIAVAALMVIAAPLFRTLP